MSFRTCRRYANQFATDTKGRRFVVDISMNWPSNRNWQTKVLDAWKATQLNLLRQKSVNPKLSSASKLTDTYSIHLTRDPGLQHRRQSTDYNPAKVCLFVGCLTSQQHASVSQGWMCSDNLTCCHTEIEVADQTFYLTHSPGRPVPALTL